MYRDMNSNADVNESVRPAVITGSTNGQGVDLRGADSALIAISVGAITGSSGDAGVTLEESDDNSIFTDVADADILGTEPAALAANTAYQFGYSGSKRYVRAVADPGGETNVAIAVTIIRGGLHRAPDEAPRSNATSIVSDT